MCNIMVPPPPRPAGPSSRRSPGRNTRGHKPHCTLSTDPVNHNILVTRSQMANFLNNILFIFQRLNWMSVLDILLVTLIFFILLYSLRDTQAMVLLRGMIFLVVALVLLTTLAELPAFSWLIQSSLPALLLAIPVIFAPEIRRALA